MSSPRVNSRNSTFRVILMILSLVCFQFAFVSSRIMEENDKDSLLRELSGAHLLLSASPVILYFINVQLFFHGRTNMK